MLCRRAHEDIDKPGSGPAHALVDIPLIIQELDRDDLKFKNVRWAWDEAGWKKAKAKDTGSDMGLDADSDGEIDDNASDDDDDDFDPEAPVPRSFQVSVAKGPKGGVQLANGINAHVRYVLNLDGTPLSAENVKIANQLVHKVVMKEWATEGTMPACWSDATGDQETRLLTRLRHRLPQFGYCSFNWKGLKFIRRIYPAIMQSLRRKAGRAAKKARTESMVCSAHSLTTVA
jgi:hypothetical protein